MKRALLAVLLVTSGLAGCIGSDDAPAEPASPDRPPTNASASAELVHFRNGSFIEDPADDAPNPTAWTNRTGFSGAEPTLDTLPSGEVFVQAWDRTLRSTDGARSFESVYDFEGLFGGSSGDPFLWTDPETERVYWMHMSPRLDCNTLGWSTDGGETWTRNELACGLPGVEFTKFGGGPPGPEPNPRAGAQHPTVLYLCYNKGGAVCAPSYDGGETWPFEVPIPCSAGLEDTSPGCPRVSFQPVVGPDGTAYLPVRDARAITAAPSEPAGCPSHLALTRDSGLTWTTQAGPADPCLALRTLDVGPNGTLYALGRDYGTQTIHLASSDDGGKTWQTSRVTPPDVETVAFQALAAGEDGRLGVALVGADESHPSPSDAAPQARWHLHTVVTTDADTAAPTFTGLQATDDPVQVGPICKQGSLRCEGDRNLLDFIDAASGPNGTFYVSYADGCVDACANASDPAPEDSRDAATSVAWLTDWSLEVPRGGDGAVSETGPERAEGEN